MKPTTQPPKDSDPLRTEVRVESYALKRCGCATPTAKCPDAPRTVQPAKVNPDTALVFDVRREADYAASGETIPGAMWKNPEKIDAWIDAIPRTLDVVIYCVRGGSVSNAVLDRLLAAGVKARYIEGGIEAYQAAGGKLAAQ
ncbi:MAG: rhodanese-like domain-containing protein [Thiobacillus sp.]